MIDKKKNNDLVTKVLIEKFRIITPILVTVSIFLLGGISIQLNKMDNKLFTHLTNHEIHTPRADVISKGVFDTHCMISERDRKELVTHFNSIEENLKKIYISIK